MSERIQTAQFDGKCEGDVNRAHKQPGRPDAERHNRVLLHALQTGHPVQRGGRNAFIKALYFQDNGGGIDVRLYLAGDAEPHAPDEIELASNHHSLDLE
ncbi:hypothetical protein [Massilia endophytica]|uniref:hypothetical protein n=1 Tax=Massilia endophytica TaxID=2899220 RepID=UPI001E54B618|nr:hypothetical protein [Massilia endophytica]UGQ45107.1 hypothetical protein LSQ66_15040 [Massilia endophytica]